MKFKLRHLKYLINPKSIVPALKNKFASTRTNLDNVFDSFLEYDDIINSLYPTCFEGFLEKKGYYLFDLPPDMADELRKFSEDIKKISFDDLYLAPCKFSKRSYEGGTEKFNENISFFDPLGCTEIKDKEVPASILSQISFYIRDNCFEIVGCPFVVVGIRGWISKPNSQRYGPNLQHSDGFPPGHLKVMVYPNPLDEDFGFLEIEDREIKNNNPCCVLFENTKRLHSGVPGKKMDRISWEITLMKTIVHPSDQQFIHFAVPHSHQERHLANPGIYYKHTNLSAIDIRRVDYSSPLKNVNLGSGRNYQDGWLCFDEIDSPSINKISFDHNTVLPISDKAVQLVYSSHFIEHLPDKTVDRVFSESKRILSDKGLFLLKLPDFDLFLNAYRKGNLAFFNKSGRYGVDGISWSWKNFGLDVGPANIVSAMFASFWNQSYGDHFSGNFNVSETSYHGPARIKKDELEKILRNKDVRSISKTLVEFIKESSDFKQFNHQNAWSKSDLESLAKRFGFRLVTTCKSEILTVFKHIKEIQNMSDWSLFMLLEPVI